MRLENIRIPHGGPLQGDFELEPGDLNLIYGRNETGKTYLVEALIQVLFSKGKRGQAAWGLREWDLKGRILVSGLDEEPVRFTTTGKKVEEFWTEESGLPPDLARLLVVKGGDAFLDSKAVDGVGENTLRKYLSGEGILDGIETRISATVRAAMVEGNTIQGNATGELRSRSTLVQKREGIDRLLTEAEDKYASGEAHVLKSEIERLQDEIDQLNKARRHRASVLFGQLETQRRQQQGLPEPQELSQVSEQLAIYDVKASDVEEKKVALANLDIGDEDLRWTKKALELYREMAGSESVSAARPVLLVAALGSLLVGVGAAFSGYMLFTLVCAAIASGLVGFYYIQVKKTLASAGEGRELERLREEFKERFDRALSGRAVLEAQLEKLQEVRIQSEALRTDLERAELELRQLQAKINAMLEPYHDGPVIPGEWREILNGLRQRVAGRAETMQGLERQIESLGVKEEDCVSEDPGVEWSQECYDELLGQREEKESRLIETQEVLKHLRIRTLQELDLQDGEWEDLIEKLRERREQVAEEYRQATAEILGQIQVDAVLKELREQENERIAEGLKSESIQAPLLALTGRYDAVRLDEGGTLVLQNEHDECPLPMASTGTREQAFLALRMGFASLIMKGRKGPLILDDAFQHSDWRRRDQCVRELLNLVQEGWQVFYFTMDDHIRDLFTEVGQTLGDRFKKVELH